MDCNDCKYLSCTEAEQKHLKQVFGEIIPHICIKYNKRVIHRASNIRHSGYLYPCDECEKENEHEMD